MSRKTILDRMEDKKRKLRWIEKKANKMKENLLHLKEEHDRTTEQLARLEEQFRNLE